MIPSRVITRTILAADRTAASSVDDSEGSRGVDAGILLFM